VLNNESGLVNYSRDYFENRYKNEISQIKYLLPTRLTVYIPTVDIFCLNSCLVADSDLSPYYFDSNHLNLSGARLLYTRLSHVFSSSILVTE